MPSLLLLALGSAYVDQGNTIQFVGSSIFFSGFFVSSWMIFGWIDLMDVAGVLQEAGDADSSACTRSQV